MTTDTIDTTRPLRDALAHFPAGMVALSATGPDGPQVLVASSFSVGISEAPPLALFSVQKTSSTWPKIKQAPMIGVSVIGEDHNPVCRQLASRDAANRLKGVQTASGDEDDLYIAGSPLWLTCSLYNEVDAGDHVLNLLRIEHFQVHSTYQPLVFHRSSFSRLLAS